MRSFITFHSLKDTINLNFEITADIKKWSELDKRFENVIEGAPIVCEREMHQSKSYFVEYYLESEACKFVNLIAVDSSLIIQVPKSSAGNDLELKNLNVSFEDILLLSNQNEKYCIIFNNSLDRRQFLMELSKCKARLLSNNHELVIQDIFFSDLASSSQTVNLEAEVTYSCEIHEISINSDRKRKSKRDSRRSSLGNKIYELHNCKIHFPKQQNQLDIIQIGMLGMLEKQERLLFISPNRNQTLIKKYLNNNGKLLYDITKIDKILPSTLLVLITVHNIKYDELYCLNNAINTLTINTTEQSEKIKELYKTINILQTENKKLKHDNIRLLQCYNETHSEYDKLFHDYQILNKKYEAVDQENGGYEKLIYHLQHNLDDHENTLKQYENENAILRRQFSVIDTEHQKLCQKYSETFKINRDYRNDEISENINNSNNNYTNSFNKNNLTTDNKNTNKSYDVINNNNNNNNNNISTNNMNHNNYINNTNITNNNDDHNNNNNNNNNNKTYETNSFVFQSTITTS